PDTPKISPEPKEVALHIEMPIEKLISLKIKQKPIPSGALMGTVVPSYFFENHFIWGATAMILTEFKFILQNPISN
ncbi:MAG: coenzyme A pyrophosphatase, partial [Flavobacteriia bacterium]|nr:coenzyme A pyrophosphatase [Flavobacteriia bacterium]